MSAQRFPKFLPTLIAINATGHMALSGGRVTGSLFILKNDLPEALVGLYMALFSVISVMTAISVGRWVDRVGSGRVMRYGIGLMLFGAWLPVAFLSLPAILLAGMALGFAFNLLSVAAQNAVGHLDENASSAQRLSFFAWFALGHSASSVIGPAIAGVLIDQVGIRMAFAAMALFTCVAAWLVFNRARGLPGAKLAATSASASAAGVAADVAAPASSVAPASGVGPAPDAAAVSLPPARKHHAFDLLSTPELRRIYWVSSLAATAWDLFLVMLPVLGHRLGFSASIIGSVYSAFAVGTFAARLAMPWLSSRFNEWQIMRAAMVVTFFAFCAFPWCSAAPMLMVVGLMFGSAIGMSQPNILSLLHSTAPVGRTGEAVGLRSVLSHGCSIAVPLVFGVLVSSVSISAVLMASSVLFATGLYPTHHGVRARRRQHPG